MVVHGSSCSLTVNFVWVRQRVHDKAWNLHYYGIILYATIKERADGGGGKANQLEEKHVPILEKKQAWWKKARGLMMVAMIRCLVMTADIWRNGNQLWLTSNLIIAYSLCGGGVTLEEIEKYVAWQWVLLLHGSNMLHDNGSELLLHSSTGQTGGDVRHLPTPQQNLNGALGFWWGESLSSGHLS